MRNTTDVTGGKPIAVLLQPISGESAIHPLVAFYDIHGGKREMLFFYFVPDTTRDKCLDRTVMIQVLRNIVFFKYLTNARSMSLQNFKRHISIIAIISMEMV
jgi:hypothetical protein